MSLWRRPFLNGNERKTLTANDFEHIWCGLLCLVRTVLCILKRSFIEQYMMSPTFSDYARLNQQRCIVKIVQTRFVFEVPKGLGRTCYSLPHSHGKLSHLTNLSIELLPVNHTYSRPQIRKGSCAAEPQRVLSPSLLFPVLRPLTAFTGRHAESPHFVGIWLYSHRWRELCPCVDMMCDVCFRWSNKRSPSLLI